MSLGVTSSLTAISRNTVCSSAVGRRKRYFGFCMPGSVKDLAWVVPQIVLTLPRANVYRPGKTRASHADWRTAAPRQSGSDNQDHLLELELRYPHQLAAFS